MATGANTTPLGRLSHPSHHHHSHHHHSHGGSKTSLGGSLLKPSYMSSQSSHSSGKRSHDDFSEFRFLNTESTNWPPEVDSKKKKRRSRWEGDDKEKVFIPGMPTILPNNLSESQERAYLLQLQIEEISRRLRTGDLGIPPNPEDRSPSPEPIYNSEGKRLNTREYRTRKKLEDERHVLIQEMYLYNTDYKPPADYKPPMVKVSEKVMIPQEEHPDINFVGLLIGPRGNTLKAMEKETGAKIIIRGKGSVKEGKVGRKDGQPLPGEDEPLHAFVTANSPESVKKAVDKIKEIIRQGVEVPEGQNDLRRMQLRELALLNGTLRESEGPRCSNCGASSHRTWQCPDKPNVTNNVICTNCGGAGHIARDCREKGPSSGIFGATDKSKIDEEYMSLMAELGEGPPPPPKTGTIVTSQATSNPLAAPPGPPRAIMPPPPPPPPPPPQQPQYPVSPVPGLTIQSISPVPTLLAPPPPPPQVSSQSEVPPSSSIPWLSPQSGVTQVTAAIQSPWQQAQYQQAAAAPVPLPVPPPPVPGLIPPTVAPAFPWTAFMGLPPPPPTQPPMPPVLPPPPGTITPPPPPPPPPRSALQPTSTSVTSTQATELTSLTLPNLFTAPPPPPPPS